MAAKLAHADIWAPVRAQLTRRPRAPLDWNDVDLVVFDVDGTLYDERRLRLAMLRQLLSAAWRARSLDTLRTLRTFRRVRESLSDQPGSDFMQLQYLMTADRHRKDPEEVRALTQEWIDRAPLPLLETCRYPYVDAVFHGLKSQGKQVAVFSDYPALEKMAALGLRANPIVCVTDPGVRRLKPDPYGLLSILERTGTRPQRALMIGDRFERDALAAERAGVRALIRSKRPHWRFDTFRAFNDPVFQPLLVRAGLAAAA